MTKTYRAAELILSGVTERPEDISKTLWKQLKQRYDIGELWLARKAGLVCGSLALAEVADMLASGYTQEDLIERGEDAATVGGLYSAWVKFGTGSSTNPRASRPNDPQEGETTSEKPNAARFLRKFFASIEDGAGSQSAEDLVGTPDFEALSSAISGAFQYVSAGVAVPNGYFTFRWDDDLGKPLEVSFGMTLRQRVPNAPLPRLMSEGKGGR